ncbi:DUF5658 family protein [Robertmurraya massiliosenegalensis]|uniref:DUF5658 family protein n=1 Tax=Robertmurraya massiliosenegalensis TaxID=1287657 RepID=UPI001CA35135
MMRISTLLLYLSFFNLFDGFVTFFGIHFKKIEEFNPLMERVIHMDLWLFLLLKGSLSIFLIILAHFLRNLQVSLYVKQLIIFSLLLYSIVALVHVSWIVLSI